MTVAVLVDVFDFGPVKEARALDGRYAGQGITVAGAVKELRSRLPLLELPAEPEFKVTVHKMPPKMPDLVAAVYGNGHCEARVRGTDCVVAGASDTTELVRYLKRLFPRGFSLDLRHDPHM